MSPSGPWSPCTALWVRLLEPADLLPALKHPLSLPAGPAHHPLWAALPDQPGVMPVSPVGPPGPVMDDHPICQGLSAGQGWVWRQPASTLGRSICWLYDSGCKQRSEFVGGVSGGTEKMTGNLGIDTN